MSVKNRFRFASRRKLLEIIDAQEELIDALKEVRGIQEQIIKNDQFIIGEFKAGYEGIKEVSNRLREIVQSE